jgi:hypothetical protein
MVSVKTGTKQQNQSGLNFWSGSGIALGAPLRTKTKVQKGVAAVAAAAAAASACPLFGPGNSTSASFHLYRRHSHCFQHHFLQLLLLPPHLTKMLSMIPTTMLLFSDPALETAV